MVYLSASQQIFQKQYGLGQEFPYIFASLAISVGFATFLNSRLVIRFGMMKLVHIAMLGYVLTSILYLILYANQPNPSVIILVSFFAVQFFCIGFLFGNLRALAMEPMGHIAGVGSALNGFISTVMAVPIADYIGSFVDETVIPLFVGFSICGLISLILFYGQAPYMKRVFRTG
jgi:DHA1 family bicyclomycin/chloramphenicol resistance-like MFS transporter